MSINSIWVGAACNFWVSGTVSATMTGTGRRSASLRRDRASLYIWPDWSGGDGGMRDVAVPAAAAAAAAKGAYADEGLLGSALVSGRVVA